MLRVADFGYVDTSSHTQRDFFVNYLGEKLYQETHQVVDFINQDMPHHPLALPYYQEIDRLVSEIMSVLYR